ncbi:helix-turn-helix transcriptional regulator [Thermopolyspora sp. NPDC052614]|uniref:helix-turn-helix domain-containing protein n=1 Tax=Thermopolyspora sp. NPDC052614 TaxID=3155682 RepID=UPI0034473EA6
MTAHSDGDEPTGILPFYTGGPTVLRIILGAQLRRLRLQRGISLERAGAAIRASHAKMSRMELGRVGFKLRDVADLLTLYGVTDPDERETLLGRAERANSPGWWHKYDEILPQWFRVYIGLEEAASIIRAFEIQFVPGLLQSTDYARAVILLRHATAPQEEIEQRVELRQARQRRITSCDGPKLWVVLDEAVLRRHFGGREVMREQIGHLLELSEHPNITLQVLPFDHGGHAAAGGPFSILRFSEAELPDVVYLEQLTSALYLDKRQDTEHYMKVMDRVCMEAMSAATTRRFLNIMRRDLSP